MSNLPNNSIFRVLNKNGQTKGTAFLVTRSLAVTCLHVIEACQVVPGEEILLRLEKHHLVIPTIVSKTYLNQQMDVAFLELSESLPLNIHPFELGESLSHRNEGIQTFGYPTSISGLWGKGSAYGHIKTEDGLDLIQLFSNEITRGFSGAPVWDSQSGQAIGMVVSIMPMDSSGRLSNVAFAIPSETLCQMCPAVKLGDDTDIVRSYLRQVSNQRFENLQNDGVFLPREVFREREVDGNILNLTEKNIYKETDRVSIPLEEALHTYSRIILLGDPGAGKSTSLKHLSKVEADLTLQSSQMLIPIYVDLMVYNGQALSTFFAEHFLNFVRKSGNPGGITLGEVENLIVKNSASFLFLIDSLDEVRQEFHAQIRLALKDLLESQSACVIACRTEDFDFSLGMQRNIFTLIGLSQEQIQKRLKERFPEMGLYLYETRIRRNIKLRTLISNPLFLAIAELILNSSADVMFPENPGLLIRTFIEALPRIRRLDGRSSQVSFDLVKGFIAELAYEMKVKSMRDPTLEEIRALNLPSATKQPEQLLKQAMDWRMLSSDGSIEGKVTFAHPLFMEYFAAEHLRRLLVMERNYGQVLGPLLTIAGRVSSQTNVFFEVPTTMHLENYDYYPLTWRGVLLMLVNLHDDTEGLIQWLARRAISSSHIDHLAFLVFGMWQERSESRINQTVMEDVAKALVSELNDPDPFWRWQAASNLEQMGVDGLEIVKMALKVADGTTRYHAILILSAHASEMTDLLLDSMEDPFLDVRRVASQVLEQTGGQQVIQLLLARSADHVNGSMEELLGKLLETNKIETIRNLILKPNISSHILEVVGKSANEFAEISILINAIYINIINSPKSSLSYIMSGVRSFGGLHFETTLDILRDMLSSSDPAKKAYAIDFVFELISYYPSRAGSVSTVELVLQTMLQSPQKEIRKKAIVAVGEMRAENLLGLLFPHLDDIFTDIRQETVVSLIRLGFFLKQNLPSDSLIKFILILDGVRPPSILKNISTETMIQFYSRFIHHDQASIRKIAAKNLIETRLPILNNPFLLAMLHDSDPQICQFVAAHIVRTTIPTTLRLLISPLTTTKQKLETTDRIFLSNSLNLIEEHEVREECSKTFLLALKQCDKDQVEILTNSLVRIGVTNTLGNGLFNPSENVRDGAANALIRIGTASIPCIEYAINENPGSLEIPNAVRVKEIIKISHGF